MSHYINNTLFPFKWNFVLTEFALTKDPTVLSLLPKKFQTCKHNQHVFCVDKTRFPRNFNNETKIFE